MRLDSAFLAFCATPLFAAVALAADVSPAQPVIPDRTFSLHDFGAVADARTSNTEAFKRAVAAVNEAGGGTLIVRPGIYLTDPFELCSGINLHLDSGATILFAPHAMPPESGGRGGAHLKSARDRGGLVENLTFSDLVMKNVGEALVFTSYYEATDLSIFFRPQLRKVSIDLVNGGHDQTQPVTATTPKWRNITVRNVTASCLWDAGFILGLPEMPAENIVLDHVSIHAPEGLRINYARDVTLHDVHITPERGPPLIVGDTVTGLTR